MWTDAACPRPPPRFCEADASTLWIMCVGKWLDWGVADDRPVTIRAEGLGLSRTVRGGWRRTDVTGEALIQERRSGAVATLAASRGTSCSVEVAEYVVRRINGHRLPAVERVLRTMQEMRAATLGLMRWLTPPDFARFVDLVFASSGSRRVGTLGRAQKTLNVDLVLPIMGHEHASLNQGSSLIVDVHAGPPRPSGNRVAVPGSRPLA